MTKFTNTNNISAPADSLSANTLQAYDRNLLRRAVEEFVISRYTAKKTQPKYNGKTAVYSVFDQIPETAFTTAVLADGVTPAATDLTKTSVSADIVNRGAFIELTDEVSLYHEDGAKLIKESTDNLGKGAGMAIEKTLFAEAIAGAGIDQHTTPAGSTEAGLDVALLALRNNLGKKFTSMLTGSKNIDTKTIREAYIGLCHPDDVAKLEAIAGWVGVEKYASQDAMPLEIGSYKTSRWIETTLATKGTLVILAEEGLAEIGVASKGKIQTIVNGLGSAGSADPLSQRQSVGAKFQMAAKVLRPEWVAKAALV